MNNKLDCRFIYMRYDERELIKKKRDIAMYDLKFGYERLSP